MNGLPLSLGAVAAIAVAARVARRGSLSLLDYSAMLDAELVENQDRQRTSLKRRREQRAKMHPALFRPGEVTTADRQVAWREEELAAIQAQRARRGSAAAGVKKILYHASPPENRASIRGGGLEPGSVASYGPPAVYLFRDASFAENYRSEPMDVWEVDATGIRLKDDPEDSAGAAYVPRMAFVPRRRVTFTGTFLNGDRVTVSDADALSLPGVSWVGERQDEARWTAWIAARRASMPPGEHRAWTSWRATLLDPGPPVKGPDWLGSTPEEKAKRAADFKERLAAELGQKTRNWTVPMLGYTGKSGSRAARESSTLAELRRVAEWLAEDDPDWAEGGCADMSGLLLDYASERGLSGVRVVSGWAARAKNAKKGFPHAWLEVDGVRFDPSAHVNRIPLRTWVIDAAAGRLAIAGSYLDPDDPYVREDNGFRLETLLRAMDVSRKGSRSVLDWTPDRTPEQVARDAEARRAWAEQQATRQAERQRIRRSSDLTVSQIQAILRAARLPVTGDRVDLVRQLAKLDALRGTDPAILASMTVRQLKSLLAPLRAGRGLTTRPRLLARALELQGPLVPVPARKKVPATPRAILWTNPFTGRTETLGWVHSALQEQATLAAWSRRHEDAYRDAVHHVHDLREPDVRSGGSGYPEASEADREAFFAVAKLERSAAGPALSGDLGKLRAIQQQVRKVIAGRVR